MSPSFTFSFFILALAASLLSSSAHPLSLGAPKRSSSLARDNGVNIVGGGRRFNDIRDANQVRARRLPVTVSDRNVTPFVNVDIGDPPTRYTLKIDTATAITWIAPRKRYTPTKASISTNATVTTSTVPTSGVGPLLEIIGKEFLDTISFSSNLVVHNQSITVAEPLGLPYDGVLGLGFVAFTVGSLSTNQSVPTVMNNLFNQHTISTESVGFSISLENDRDSTFAFGNVKPPNLVSPIRFAPIITTGAASFFWAVNATVSYGSNPISSSGSFIIDTGIAGIALASSAFEAYKDMTGAVVDPETGYLKINSAQRASLQPLTFVIDDGHGGFPCTLLPNSQVWPAGLSGAPPGTDLLVFIDLGDDGFAALLGTAFLKNFFTLLDTTNKRVGFAENDFTNPL